MASQQVTFNMPWNVTSDIVVFPVLRFLRRKWGFEVHVATAGGMVSASQKGFRTSDEAMEAARFLRDGLRDAFDKDDRGPDPSRVPMPPSSTGGGSFNRP